MSEASAADVIDEGEPWAVLCGKCEIVLPTLADGCVDAVVTDPPYALTGASRNGSPRTNDQSKPFERHNLQPKGFMGTAWDGLIPGVETWQAVLRTLKPGGVMLAFGGTRTFHRLACAIEDADIHRGRLPCVDVRAGGSRSTKEP